MKSHDIAKILESLSKVLKKLPNEDIQKSINLISKLIDDSDQTSPTKRKPSFTPPEIPEQVLKALHEGTPAEAETTLNSNSLFISTASIINLAKILGIETSKRQSRSAVINSIIRYLEARKMSSIIRNDITAETKPYKSDE